MDEAYNQAIRDVMALIEGDIKFNKDRIAEKKMGHFAEDRVISTNGELNLLRLRIEGMQKGRVDSAILPDDPMSFPISNPRPD